MDQHELDGLAARIRLLALDVDGTLTDGAIQRSGDDRATSSETLSWYVRDGIAHLWLVDAGVTIVWISGRGGAGVQARGAELRAHAVELKVRDKAACLAKWQAALGVGPAETAAMGDDLPDLALAQRSALFAAPADAVREVRARAAWVAHAPGGRGALREFAEWLLRARGAWDGIAARHGGS